MEGEGCDFGIHIVVHSEILHYLPSLVSTFMSSYFLSAALKNLNKNSQIFLQKLKP